MCVLIYIYIQLTLHGYTILSVALILSLLLSYCLSLSFQLRDPASRAIIVAFSQYLLEHIFSNLKKTKHGAKVGKIAAGLGGYFLCN